MTLAAETPQLPKLPVFLAAPMVLFLPIKFLAPLDIASANLGVALAVAIYPLCVVSVRAYRWGVVLLALIWSSAVAGLVLAYTARSTHEVSNRTVVSMTATIISLGITFAAVTGQVL